MLIGRLKPTLKMTKRMKTLKTKLQVTILIAVLVMLIALGGGMPAASAQNNTVLTFEGTNIGISPVTLADVHLSNSAANTIPVEISHGSIAVVAYYTVQGSFGLAGQTNRGGVPVTLSGGQVFGGGPYSEKSQNRPGINLIVENVIADTYTVTTAQPRCLNVTAELNKTITMTGDYTMQPLTLRCGNAIWTDNVIDVNDISIVGSQWGKSQADLPVGETLNGDVNFDNIVNIRDWALVAGNYGLSSEDVYDNWTP